MPNINTKKKDKHSHIFFIIIIMLLADRRVYLVSCSRFIRSGLSLLRNQKETLVTTTPSQVQAAPKEILV